MAVFYKYVERQASDQIDWGAISKSMSDTLDAENKRRDEKKQAIDDASRKYISELQNQPQTESADLNTRLGQFANDASSMSKMLLDDLKAGKISLKDYTIRTQNLADDTKVALDLVQVYGERYKEVMEGINSGKLSAANGDLMAQFEGFTNLKNNKLYVDPTSGRVYAADEVVGPDGVKTMGKNVRNVSALKQTMQQDILRFNADNELNTRVEKLGGFITESIKTGGLYRIGAEIKFEDATKQQYYDQYKRDLTEELIGGPNNPRAISFFIDNMRMSPDKVDAKGKIIASGKPYRLVTKQEDVKGPEDILIQQNANGQNMPVLTEQQMKDAESWITVQMRQKIKQSTEKQSLTIPERPQPTTSDSDGKDKVDATLATNILLLRYGTPEEKKSAMSSLEDHESMKGKKFVIGDDNRISVVNVNDRSESTNPVSLDASIVSDKDFVSSFNTLFKLGDIDKAYVKAQQGGRFKGKQPVLSGKLESEKKDVKNSEKFATIAKQKVVVNKNDQDATAKTLNDAFSQYGYSVEATGNPNLPFGSPHITITSPQPFDEKGVEVGDPVTKEFKLVDGVAKEILKWIISNQPSAMKLDKISSELNNEYEAIQAKQKPAPQTKPSGGGSTSKYNK